jgi:hypothetical protein
MTEAEDANEQNEQKLKELQERADDYEKEVQRKARLFDPKKLVSKSSKVRVVEDQVLGKISYGPIVTEDLLEINRQETNEEKGFVMLWIALRKAYPDVTLEDVKAFALEDFTRLMKAIFGDQVFLQQQQKTSQNGLTTPATFKGSG